MPSKKETPKVETEPTIDRRDFLKTSLDEMLKSVEAAAGYVQKTVKDFRESGK